MLAAARGDDPFGFELLVKEFNPLPGAGDAFAGFGGAQFNLSLPPAGGRLGVVQSGFLLQAGLFGAQAIISVGLVDEYHVGQFHDSFLDALQFVARAGQLE